MVPRRKISKNRDHTTSKVHIQARRKIDNKKKFTVSLMAAWIWYQEKDVHEQIWIYKVHIYWSESLQLSLFLNEIIAKLEWTEINSQGRTERAESLCWFSIQIIQSSQELSLCCMEFVKRLLVHNIELVCLHVLVLCLAEKKIVWELFHFQNKRWLTACVPSNSGKSTTPRSFIISKTVGALKSVL